MQSTQSSQSSPCIKAVHTENAVQSSQSRQSSLCIKAVHTEKCSAIKSIKTKQYAVHAGKEMHAIQGLLSRCSRSGPCSLSNACSQNIPYYPSTECSQSSLCRNGTVCIRKFTHEILPKNLISQNSKGEGGGSYINSASKNKYVMSSPNS